MHPGDDALVEIALGSQAVSLADAAHVHDCASCLARVAQLSEIVSLVREGADAAFADPEPAAWARIAARLGAAETEAAPAGDLRRPRRRGRSRPVAPWIIGLVAAAVAGIVVGRVTAPDAGAGREETVVARAALDQIGTTTERGEADVVRVSGGVRLLVRTQALDAGPDPLEVWLINRDGKRMVSIGLLTAGADRTQAFAIDQRLIDDGYVVVDISREPLDGNPAHSGRSLVRGTLDT